jgi:cytoskeletal protein RodZ
MENKDSKSLTLGTKKINKTEQSKNNKTWLIVLVIFLSILFLSIVGYIIYTQFIKPTDSTDQDATNTVEESEEKSNEETATLYRQ